MSRNSGWKRTLLAAAICVAEAALIIVAAAYARDLLSLVVNWVILNLMIVGAGAFLKALWFVGSNLVRVMIEPRRK